MDATNVRYTMRDLGRDLDLADRGDAAARDRADMALSWIGRNSDLTEKLARRLRALAVADQAPESTRTGHP